MKVSLVLNHACNLRCSYCYTGEKFRRPMPLDVAKAGVMLGLDNPIAGPQRISFFGGEPLLELELMDQVIRFARQAAAERNRPVRFLVITNGTLLDADARAFLEAQDVYVALSIDGCREAHDATRRYAGGRSSYDDVVANIRPLLTERTGRVGKVLAVIDPANVEFLPRSFDALLALGARTLSMNLNYEGEWDEGARERFVVALDELGERYVDAYRRQVPFVLNLLDSKIITRVKGGFSCSDRCDFGCSEVAVSPRGRLYPCDRLVGQDDRDEMVIGDVWSGVDVERRDAMVAAKNAELEGCRECALRSRCMHWCGCVNHAMTGSVGEVSGLLCWFEQEVVRVADQCASTLFSERNPLFLRRFYAPRMRGGG